MADKTRMAEATVKKLVVENTLIVGGTEIDADTLASALDELGTLDGLTASAAELNFNDTAVAGTAVASKTLVLGANKNVDTLVIADGGLALGAGAGTAIVATAAEINRAADVSTRLIAAGSTLAVTEAAHDGKVIKLDTAAGSICTLPAATGSGAMFRFVVTTTPTSNAHIVKVTGNDVMYGLALGLDDEGVPANAWGTAADSDTITMDSSTTGGEIGDSIECIDIATDKWAVQVRLTQSGTEATPFSATVS